MWVRVVEWLREWLWRARACGRRLLWRLGRSLFPFLGPVTRVPLVNVCDGACCRRPGGGLLPCVEVKIQNGVFVGPRHRRRLAASCPNAPIPTLSHDGSATACRLTSFGGPNGIANDVPPYTRLPQKPANPASALQRVSNASVPMRPCRPPSSRRARPCRSTQDLPPSNRWRDRKRRATLLVCLTSLTIPRQTFNQSVSRRPCRPPSSLGARLHRHHRHQANHHRLDGLAPRPRGATRWVSPTASFSRTTSSQRRRGRCRCDACGCPRAACAAASESITADGSVRPPVH